MRGTALAAESRGCRISDYPHVHCGAVLEIVNRHARTWQLLLQGYTDQADAGFSKFAEAGMHVVRSVDPLETWPGIIL